ncbi:MAG TPA: sulfite exporter TauE/SafE family protein, partial [Terriglobia bacterium]|nr:sulfite exporter TauE/SafE family protein [Terriglobia bacterium]HVB28863.1 sulfite exporter TauE/SafE family protein [Terriglobia bacterium]
MTIPNAVLLFFAALAAGVQNSIAGGGSFFSFPALIFSGVPPIPANATNTVAVWPGLMASAGAYRKKLPRNPRVLVPLILASLAGGFFGAHLLVHTPQRTFMRLIPFLFLGATLLFAFGKKLIRGGTHAEKQGKPSWSVLGGVTLAQFFIAVYGGYFGGGMGILMLSLLTFLPLGDIHATNGVKALLASAANGVAIITFVAARLIFWPQALLMLVGAALGGYGGAHFAQKINPARVRAFVICVGFAMSFYFLWR